MYGSIIDARRDRPTMIRSRPILVRDRDVLSIRAFWRSPGLLGRQAAREFLCQAVNDNEPQEIEPDKMEEPL